MPKGNKHKGPIEQKRRGGHIQEGLEKRGIDKGSTQKDENREPPNKGGNKQGQGGGSAF